LILSKSNKVTFSLNKSHFFSWFFAIEFGREGILREPQMGQALRFQDSFTA
jgi:hypothetical protein